MPYYDTFKYFSINIISQYCICKARSQREMCRFKAARPCQTFCKTYCRVDFPLKLFLTYFS